MQKKDWFGLNGVGMDYRETDVNDIKSTEHAYFDTNAEMAFLKNS